MVNIIKQRRPLSERPAEAGARDVAGHWEADFMLFAQYGQCILVAHERASRFTFIERPQDRKADRTARHLAEIGRASCRERVCKYVEIPVVAGSLKQKIHKKYHQ